MKRKFIWLMMSCFMVAALVLSSCAAAEEEKVVVPEKEEKVVVPEKEEVEVLEPIIYPKPSLSHEALQKAVLEQKVVEVEKPEYGGTMNIATNYNQLRFDDLYGGPTAGERAAYTVFLSNEELTMGDWARGPAGTGETSYWGMYIIQPELWVGQLAETWEMDGSVLRYNIRPGIRYHDPALKPENEAMALVNGREFDAEDVVFELNRIWDYPASYLSYAAPRATDIKRVEAIDKYTVEIEATAPDRLSYPWQIAGGWNNIYAREVIEKWGDVEDWRLSVGTGPYYLDDYVDGSGAIMKRNPDYWMTNPVGPGKGDQLPYADAVNFYFIEDPSTRMSAMRTAKVDFLRDVDWEQLSSLQTTNPELYYVGYEILGRGIGFRMDNPEYVGYTDENGLNVRRALAMAVDQPTINKELYNDLALIMSGPIGTDAQFKSARVEIEDLPPSADGFDNSKMFGYYPDEAEALLDAAGFTGPDRMSLEIAVSGQEYIDLMTLVKADWAKIGVDLKINVMEFSAYTSHGQNRLYEDLHPSGWIGTFPFLITAVRYGERANISMLNDAKIIDAYYAMMDSYFDWDTRLPLLKDIGAYIIDLAPIIQLPSPTKFNVWQPWLKNYHGEFSVGNYRMNTFAYFSWIDQDLKKELTGK